jgi:hemerythrin-like domain-containing protein
MKIIDILTSEHRIIERLLSTLETGTWMISVDEPLQPKFFIEATDFIMGFADDLHHKKEEGILFEAMMESDDEHGNSMAAAMLHEHELARAYTHALRQAAERLITGQRSAISEVIYQSRHYTALLRNHITMEEQFVFPYAAQIIPAQQQAAIDQRIELDRETENSTEDLQRFLLMVNRLEEQVFPKS